MAPAQESNTVQVECEMASLEEDQLPDCSHDQVAFCTKRRHNIFVSHSGAEMGFVEQVCEDLKASKTSPLFRRRFNSSSKEEEFGESIFTAAQECEVAIVVVSDEYFTRSHWPMLELVAFVQAPRCKILPLFFGLSCKEFKNPKRREHYFQVWNSWAKSDSSFSVDAWKDALRELDRRNGMEYTKALGEIGYRKEVVTTVCSMVQLGSQDKIIDVEKGTIPGNQGPQQPGACATRPKVWSAYLRLILLSVIIFFGTLFLGSAYYSVFFCDQGFPLPFGTTFLSIT